LLRPPGALIEATDQREKAMRGGIEVCRDLGDLV
jgi:hypothetical protein